MQFSLFDLLIIIGITQGVVTGILLLFSNKNPRSNKFLGLALIAFCLVSTKILLHTLHLWDTQFFRYFPNGAELVIPPLIYFYVVSMISPKFRLKRSYSIHFIPFILSQGYAFFVYFSMINISVLEQKDLIANKLWFDEIKDLEEYLVLISMTIYLFFGYIKLKEYRVCLDNTTSDNAFPDFNWLKNIFILFVTLGIFLLFNLMLDLVFNFRESYVIHWDIYTLFISFLIYYLGFVGYQQPHYQIEEIKISDDNLNRIELSKEKELEIIEILEKALQNDKVFLNPIITIQELSKSLEIPQRNLSKAINNTFQKSFRDLINEYRIKEVKLNLNHKDLKRMSILGIALECGFNSEASFYRIFKKDTGMSPKEYIEHINKS